MPIKLSFENKLTFGGPIDPATVKKMITKYRKNHEKDPSALKFVHYSVAEVLALFCNNGILDKKLFTWADFDFFKQYGLKIYTANHYDASTCPPGRNDSIKPGNYLNKDTAILINTRLEGKKWVELLIEDENSISILGSGEGLDKGTICPPDCPPASDPDGYENTDLG